jgi:hypothetical protein
MQMTFLSRIQVIPLIGLHTHHPALPHRARDLIAALVFYIAITFANAIGVETLAPVRRPAACEPTDSARTHNSQACLNICHPRHTAPLMDLIHGGPEAPKEFLYCAATANTVTLSLEAQSVTLRVGIIAWCLICRIAKARRRFVGPDEFKNQFVGLGPF